MKKFILALALSVSSIAFAQEAAEGLRVFSVKKAEFAPEHISHFTSGSVKVDYDQNLVTLHVSRVSPCPVSKVCAMMVPQPLIVELPITSIEEAFCGIRQITATQDDLNSDGTLTTISITDTSDMICKSFARFHSKAEYETSQIDPTSGRQISTKSLMLLEKMSLEDLQ